MVKLSHKTVRAKMLEQNLKQEPFAEVLGISVRHVRSICYKDMDVAVSLCYRLSQALQTPMESLLIIREEEEWGKHNWIWPMGQKRFGYLSPSQKCGLDDGNDFTYVPDATWPWKGNLCRIATDADSVWIGKDISGRVSCVQGIFLHLWEIETNPLFSVGELRIKCLDCWSNIRAFGSF